jgi:hypothetical protein
MRCDLIHQLKLKLYIKMVEGYIAGSKYLTESDSKPLIIFRA